jgi:hypothetical protein
MSRFDYVQYDEIAKVQQAVYKELFSTLEDSVKGLSPGRATSLILTKLEEAYMWVGKAIRDDQIARYEVKGEETPLQEQRCNS